MKVLPASSVNVTRCVRFRVLGARTISHGRRRIARAGPRARSAMPPRGAVSNALATASFAGEANTRCSPVRPRGASWRSGQSPKQEAAASKSAPWAMSDPTVDALNNPLSTETGHSPT